MNTSARLAANHANAQLSTGPTTQAGKQKSSRNALTTGLTGHTVRLPSESAKHYEAHLAAYRDRFRPANLAETTLVQSIADTDWRLARVPLLLLALEARAADEMDKERAEQYEDVDDATRRIDIALESFLRYEKQIRNLYLQESRLHRRREKDLAELGALQAERQARRSRELRMAAELYSAAQADGKPFAPADVGFEFSMSDVQLELDRQRGATLLRSARPAVPFSLGSQL